MSATPDTIRAPRLTRSEIIRKAENLTKRFAKMIEPELALVYTGFEPIYREIIYPEFEIEIEERVDLGFDGQDDKIFGEYDPISNVVFIDDVISEESGDPRRSFTLWHEVGGHALLQGDWLRSEIRRLSGNGRIVTTESSINPSTMDVLERQANLFAANAGAPLWLVEHTMRRVFNLTHPIRYIGPRRYCLDVLGSCRFNYVESFNDLCQLIAYYIKPTFGGMSAESIGYQVTQTCLVQDLTEPACSLRMRRTDRKRTAPAKLGIPAMAAMSTVLDRVG